MRKKFFVDAYVSSFFEGHLDERALPSEERRDPLAISLSIFNDKLQGFLKDNHIPIHAINSKLMTCILKDGTGVMHLDIRGEGLEGEQRLAAMLLGCCKALEKGTLDKSQMFALGMHMSDLLQGLESKEIGRRVISLNASKAANHRHDQPNGSRNKKALVLEAWATGAYKTRNACAEAVHAPLCISYETARKHLINSPEPNKKGS